VTIESKAYITFGSKFNVAAFVFEDAEVTAADSNIARSMHNSMRVQPKIKMTVVEPETLRPKPDSADGAYVKFPRNSHMFCVKQHSETNVSIGRHQGE